MFTLRNRTLLSLGKCYTAIVRNKTSQEKLGTTIKVNKSWLPKDKYTNPIETLQPMVTIPLLDPPEGLFNSTVQVMQRADKLFQSGDGKTWRTFKGAIHHTKLEDFDMPEVAFIGRSNVCKSTLVSTLMYHSEKVLVSARPGHTQSMKQFLINKRFTLVDMPGYGHNMPKHFRKSVEQYLANRAQLHRTFVLVDGKVGVTPLDETALEMMEELAKPYAIVLTKIDKASATKMAENFIRLRKMQTERLQCCFPQIFLISSQADIGVSFLRAFIAEITGLLQQ